MSISHARLDRFIGEHCQISRRDVRLMLAQKRIVIDGKVVNDLSAVINDGRGLISVSAGCRPFRKC